MDCSWRFFVYIAGADATLYLKTKMKREKKKEKKKKTDQEIGSSRNHLSTFLYSRYCNTITLYSVLHTVLFYASLRSKNPETIVIVSTGRPNLELL